MNDKTYEHQLTLLDEYCDYGLLVEASELLMNLHIENNPIAQRLALLVLDKQKGDRYLQGYAFTVLYGASRPEAIEYIHQHAATCDVFIFGAMIAEVTSDSEQEEGREELMKAVEVLKQVLQERDTEELERISDDIQWFKESFKIQ